MNNIPQLQVRGILIYHYMLKYQISSGDFRLGLMFRESLDIDKGMLFIFEEVGQHSFHMKNTRIPLDIAFVKEDGTIESIKQLKPYSSLPVYSDGKVLFNYRSKSWLVY